MFPSMEVSHYVHLFHSAQEKFIFLIVPKITAMVHVFPRNDDFIPFPVQMRTRACPSSY